MVSPSGPQQILPNLNQFLRDSSKIGPEFNKALKKGSVEVAKNVVAKAKQNAGTPAEREVAKALVPRFDKIPRIEVNKTQFVSSSRRNAKRTPAAKARRIDIWFGTEFGGGKYRNAGSNTSRVTSRGVVVRKGGGYTTQFRPHLGTQGYFFYPTVRREGPNTVREYALMIDEVRKDFERGRL